MVGRLSSDRPLERWSSSVDDGDCWPSFFALWACILSEARPIPAATPLTALWINGIVIEMGAIVLIRSVRIRKPSGQSRYLYNAGSATHSDALNFRPPPFTAENESIMLWLGLKMADPLAQPHRIGTIKRRRSPVVRHPDFLSLSRRGADVCLAGGSISDCQMVGPFFVGLGG